MSVKNNGSEARRVAMRFSLFVTNIIKIGGLVIAIDELTKLQPSPLFMALAAFMMAGAQVSEATIVKLVGGLFGIHSSSSESPK